MLIDVVYIFETTPEVPTRITIFLFLNLSQDVVKFKHNFDMSDQQTEKNAKTEPCKGYKAALYDLLILLLYSTVNIEL
jgi:hypothetical protein